MEHEPDGLERLTGGIVALIVGIPLLCWAARTLLALIGM
jgi:hypothetical protein